jgi:hypothetical protein
MIFLSYTLLCTIRSLSAASISDEYGTYVPGRFNNFPSIYFYKIMLFCFFCSSSYEYWLKVPHGSTLQKAENTKGHQGAPLLMGKTSNKFEKVKHISRTCECRFFLPYLLCFLRHLNFNLWKYTVVCNPAKVIHGTCLGLYIVKKKYLKGNFLVIWCSYFNFYQRATIITGKTISSALWRKRHNEAIACLVQIL